ncbi:MAG: DUF2796 domain-containing protein [Proteobacteria bacterium]|nr:DUF2796 domain-containing protein [Pseudomonadota bacterium]
MKFFSNNIVLFALTICLFPQIVLHNFAAAGGKGHSAHQHGVAKVNVVAEGNNLTIQLEAPSESIYGFEHEAKKPADIKKRDDAVTKLKSNADKMFLTDPALGCKLTTSDVKPFVTEEKHEEKSDKKHKAGTHSEVHAVFKFECTKPPAGSILKFAARSQFKSLQTLIVQLLSGDKQGGSTIKNDKGIIQL